jgi:hypothetical protein
MKPHLEYAQTTARTVNTTKDKSFKNISERQGVQVVIYAVFNESSKTASSHDN